MPDAEEERKPYRYVRSFGSEAVVQQVAETDKVLIDTYIKELLGVSPRPPNSRSRPQG